MGSSLPRISLQLLLSSLGGQRLCYCSFRSKVEEGMVNGLGSGPVGWAFELLPAGILKKKRWDWRIEFPQWDQGEFIMSAFFCGLETIDM